MSKDEKSKLDEMIESVLTGQDRKILEDTRELNFFELGLSQFSGKNSWLTWVTMIIQVTMFIIAAWCSYYFFTAVDVLSAVKWGITASALVVMAMQVKMSLVPQMQADRIIREIKRVELLLATNARSTGANTNG